jgi:ADP-heptose:LPS heptosyltransferase
VLLLALADVGLIIVQETGLVHLSRLVEVQVLFLYHRAMLSSETACWAPSVSLFGFPCYGRLYHIKVGHDPTGERESQEQAQESEIHSFLQSGILWKY